MIQENSMKCKHGIIGPCGNCMGIQTETEGKGGLRFLRLDNMGLMTGGIDWYVDPEPLEVLNNLPIIQVVRLDKIRAY